MLSSLHFKHWYLTSTTRLGPLIPPQERCGIYVIEFADGTKYVGQSINVVTRFANHTHGSLHHGPWDDVVSLAFAPAPPLELDALESQEIARQLEAGVVLRNRKGVIHSAGPSPLDSVVTITEQKHWILGDWSPTAEDHKAFAAAAHNAGDTKLTAKAPEDVTNAVLKDLAFALENIIPAATETEKTYWTLSDYPSTAGGRYATLNTGILEFLVFPRFKILDDIADLEPEFRDAFDLGIGFFNLFLPGDVEVEDDEDSIGLSPHPPYLVMFHEYNVLTTEAYYYPIGKLEETFAALPPEMLADARDFAVTMMHERPSNLFRRWHSSALAGHAYQRILS